MTVNPKYVENLQLAFEGVACKNTKPISTFSGVSPCVTIQGHTIAELMEDPMIGIYDTRDMFTRLQEEAGPLRVFNSAAGPLNMAVAMTTVWNSKVLIPGKDLPATSVWQIKEQQLIGPEAYDEILAMGYNNFVQQKVFPMVIDPAYMGRYFQYAAEHGPETGAVYMEMGIPVLMAAGVAAGVPFETLCGMRSMTQFYMDCYKRLDKVKEVSDFIFAESTAQAEATITARKDDPSFVADWIGGWRTAPGMVNRKIFDTLVWPYMKASAEQMIRHNKIPIMHLDQNWDREMEKFAELPAGKFIINTDGMTDLTRARKLLPGVALMGDVPPTLLTTGTPEQVTDYVNRLIDSVGPEGLFVCPGCDCPVNAKYENIVAMVKATNEWK